MTVVSRLREAGFEVRTRAQWGTVRPAEYAKRAANPYYQLMPGLPYHFLHITVTADTDTQKQGDAGARQVESYGLSTPPMVSYQMLVTNEGRIFEGQNYRVKGTHTVNDKGVPGYPHDLNRHGYAVAIMQNVGDEVTDAQVRAIAACFAAAELEGHVRRGAPIYPHRMFDWKECPGDKAVARLAEISRLRTRMVQRGMGPPPPDPEPEPKEQGRVEHALQDLHGAIQEMKPGTRRTKLQEAAALLRQVLGRTGTPDDKKA